MLFDDIMIVCFDPLVGKPLHMCTRSTAVLFAYLPASMPESLITINASRPLCLFLNPNSVPVTYIQYQSNNPVKLKVSAMIKMFKSKTKSQLQKDMILNYKLKYLNLEIK